MKISRILVSTAVIIVALATAALAQMAGPGGCCSAAAIGDLTPDQQKQMNELKVESLKKTEQIRADMIKKRIEMMELTSKEKPDDSAIEKKRQEMWALQDLMRNENRELGSKIRALLTPEQKAKYGQAGFGPGCGMGAGRGCGMGAGSCGRGAGRGCPVFSGSSLNM